MDASNSMDASNRMSASNSMGVSNNWETRTGGTPGNAEHTVGNAGLKIVIVFIQFLFIYAMFI
jgi:hypothetical protein